MQFDQNNKIVQLCSEGMECEGKGDPTAARELFNEAWQLATTDFEKFTAAHYVARQRENIADKLKWDKIALEHATKMEDESINEILPSLHLNIGKCYEDLNEHGHAKEHYLAASNYMRFLPDDGYGNMIKAGIEKALTRIQ